MSEFKKERNQEVYQMWKRTNNLRSVALEFELSKERVRQIIDEIKMRERLEFRFGDIDIRLARKLDQAEYKDLAEAKMAGEEVKEIKGVGQGFYNQIQLAKLPIDNG